MQWFILVVAGLFECAWAVCMKLSNGFSDMKWGVLTIVFLIMSMALLAYSLKHLPVGTAYAVWTGIDAIGTAALGMLLFNESKELVRVLCIMMIFCGIIGLKVFSK